MTRADGREPAQRSRGAKQLDRQRAIAEYVLGEGSVEIGALAERFDTSLMTVHRDLDELESRGLLRKSRGWVTAMSSSRVEASDVYRQGQQEHEKDLLAAAALEHISPGQSVFLDDSTTTARLGPLLVGRTPLTVITNYLTLMDALAPVRDVTLIGLGGRYTSWSSSFLGSVTTTAVRALRADLFVMSTSAIVDGTCFHHTQETVDVKRAMFESAARRILVVDHTKFERRALFALARVDEFDTVIVDSGISPERLGELRDSGVDPIVVSV